MRGSAILSDGTIVLAANIGTTNPSDVSPILLNGASSTSGGAIVRLNSSGRVVLSVTRVANQVEDLAIDANDNLYVAAWSGGTLKLNSQANTLVWAKSIGNVGRIDAAGDGTVSALASGSSNPNTDNPGNGTIFVYNGSGAQLGSFSGKNNTLDICVDSASQTVISIGWRQASVSGVPIQISYLRGSSYDGTTKYTGYDWSTDSNSDRFINKPTNNMADTRGYRCSIGADGKLYGAFETAGGNHIFRYSPFDINTSNSVVGGDAFQSFYNTKSDQKTFFARYEPSTGAYLRGQQIVNRLSDGRGNTIRVRYGAIAADASGQVYIGGDSASGLPMPPNPKYTPRNGETTFNPFPDSNVGGAWFMVMSSDFSTRKFVTRLTVGGSTHTIAVRNFSDGNRKIVFGGTTTSFSGTYTNNAIQITANGGTQEGWFAVSDNN